MKTPGYVWVMMLFLLTISAALIGIGIKQLDDGRLFPAIESFVGSILAFVIFLGTIYKVKLVYRITRVIYAPLLLVEEMKMLDSYFGIDTVK